jgi:rubrerythrin
MTQNSKNLYENDLIEVTQYLLDQVQGDPDRVRETARLWVAEGVTLKPVIDVIREAKRARQEEFAVKGGADHLGVADLQRLTDTLGVMKNTPANRARWARRFHSHQAKGICPQCGFAMDAFEYRIGPQGSCPNCGHFDYIKTFTRTWAAGEQDAVDAKAQANAVKYAAEASARDAASKMKRAQRQVIDERVERLYPLIIDGELPNVFDRDRDIPWQAITTVCKGSSLSDQDIVRLWGIVYENLPRDEWGVLIDPVTKEERMDDDSDVIAFTLCHNSIDVLGQLHHKETL